MSGFRMSNDHPTQARKLSRTKDPKKFFFVFAEGVQTEIIYFNALRNCRLLKSSIEIKIMDRLHSNTGDSNQYKIVKNIESFLDQCKSIKKKDINRIKSILSKISNQSATPEEIINLMTLISPLTNDAIINEKEAMIPQLNAILTVSDFEPTFDRICIVIDRDKHSFTEEQFDNVVEIVNRHDFKLGITNPNFELFLMLHLTDLTGLDIDKVANNPAISRRTRYLEHSLKSLMKEIGKSFRKNSFDPQFFVDNFRQGYDNSKNFSNVITELKDNVGTTLFEIISEIID